MIPTLASHLRIEERELEAGAAKRAAVKCHETYFKKVSRMKVASLVVLRGSDPAEDGERLSRYIPFDSLRHPALRARFCSRKCPRLVEGLSQRSMTGVVRMDTVSKVAATAGQHRRVRVDERCAFLAGNAVDDIVPPRVAAVGAPVCAK